MKKLRQILELFDSSGRGGKGPRSHFVHHAEKYLHHTEQSMMGDDDEDHDTKREHHWHQVTRHFHQDDDHGAIESALAENHSNQHSRRYVDLSDMYDQIKRGHFRYAGPQSK